MKSKEEHTNNYNAEPVEYCAQCLSLAIRDISGVAYCDKCGCTEIKTADIASWEKMYGQYYGRDYIKH